MKRLKLLILLMLFIPLNVFATIKSEIVLENKDLYRGDKLTVTIKLHQDSNKDYINVIKGVIDFDESLFKGIDEESITVKNGWKDYVYNKDTHAIVLINKYGSTLNEEVITFEMDLKDKINPASTLIGFKDAVVSNKEGEYELDDKDSNVSINISLSDLSGGKNPAPSYGKDLKTSRAHSYHLLMIIVLDLVIAIILVLMYNSLKKKFEDPKKRRTLMLGLCLIEVLACGVAFATEVKRGDLNSDKKIDYEDVTLLANHLVNANMLSNFKFENADMNKDGYITAADLAILVDICTEKKPLVAKLSSTEIENTNYEKGSMIDLRFLAEVTDDEEIEYVLIDGKKYKVQKVENKKNEYRVELDAKETAKNYKYNVEEVILSNGKTAKVDYETTVTVLKDIPSIKAFSSKENLSSSSMNVALTIEDADSALTSSTYELKDNKGNIVQNGRLEKGKNALSLKLANAINYKLVIKLSYDRGGTKEQYKSTIEDSYDLKIITDYRLKIDNLTLMQNDLYTDELEKSLDTYLVFTSTNVSGYAPKKVLIDGNEYTTYKLGNNKYRVKIPNSFLSTGTLNLKKVTLSNGKVILVDNTINYSFLKEKPKVTLLSNEEDISKDTLNAKFSLEDTDLALSKLTVRLYDENNSLLSEEPIDKDNLDINLKTGNTSKYTIKVFADYDRLSGSNHSYRDALLYEQTIPAKLKVNLVNHRVDNKYPEKNSIINLLYELNSNYKVNVKNFIIDNIIYDVSKTSLDTYRVELDSKDTSGVKTFNTQKVIFDNGMEYDLDENISVDVLKDYPALEKFSIKENREERKLEINFDIFDREETLDKGRIVLRDKTTDEIKDEQNIIQGKNTVEFTLENAVKYNIELLIDVTLDSETLEEESPNKKKDYKLYEVEYMIVTDYKLEVKSIEAIKEGKVTNYFKKSEPIKFQIEETHLTDYVPIKVKVDGLEYDLSLENDKYTFTMEGFENSGVKTLKFESLTLSNHKELEINGTKKIEILKDAPTIEEVFIEQGKLMVDVKDEENALKDARVVIIGKDEEVLYNELLQDSPITFDKKDNTSYTIKVIASYDLDTNALGNDENEFIDIALFEKLIDEKVEYFDVSTIANITLKYTNGKYEIDKEFVTDYDLIDLSSLKVELHLSDDKIKNYEIKSYIIDNQKLIFTLKQDGWIFYQDDKVSNNLKVEYSNYRKDDEIQE